MVSKILPVDTQISKSNALDIITQFLKFPVKILSLKIFFTKAIRFCWSVLLQLTTMNIHAHQVTLASIENHSILLQIMKISSSSMIAL